MNEPTASDINSSISEMNRHIEALQSSGIEENHYSLIHARFERKKLIDFLTKSKEVENQN